MGCASTSPDYSKGEVLHVSREITVVSRPFGLAGAKGEHTDAEGFWDAHATERWVDGRGTRDLDRWKAAA